MKICAYLLQTLSAIRPRLRAQRTAEGIILLGLAALLNSTVTEAQSYSEQIVHEFGPQNSNDGLKPAAGLIDVNVSGVETLFGTTANGGSGDSGTVFSYVPSTSAYHPIFSYNTTNGDGVFDAPINVGGVLYVTTRDGGVGQPNNTVAGNGGTIVSIDATTKYAQLLYSFGTNNELDGAFPLASLADIGGILCGTTAYGGTHHDGAIFSIQPNGKMDTVLYNFSGTDGANPTASLISVNGILYGTTSSGGTHNDGTVFSINADGTNEKVLYSFSGTDGSAPLASLLDVSANGTDILYGTTSSGGTHNDGTVFSINLTTGTETTIYSFGGHANTNDGADPASSLILVNGLLFGTTVSGGSYTTLDVPNGLGTVFAINPTTHAEKIIHDFQGTSAGDGAFPNACLLDMGGILYGTTEAGGITIDGSIGDGTLFSLTPIVLPVAHDDHGTGYYNTALTVTAPGVLGNDSNGNDPQCKTALVAYPSHGTLTFNTNGSFKYVPNTGFVGTDSFTYQDVNATGKSNIATCTLTIQPVAPVAVNNSNNVNFQTPLSVPAPGVLGNDNNGGSSPMTASLVTNVSHGTLTLNSNGAFTYTPAAGFLGTDSFTYQAINSVGKSNVATATLIVQATVPTANNDHGTGYYNTVLTIGAPGVLGNDSNGGKGPLTAVLVTNPTHGTISFKSDGSFVYTPSQDYVGMDSFTYKDTNSIGSSNTATCTLTINPKAPTAVNNSNNVKKNTTLTVPAPGVLGNDDNGGSSPMTAALVTTTSHGTLTLNSSGSFTYTPNAGFTGTDSFTYQAVNNIGKSNIATATLIVQ